MQAPFVDVCGTTAVIADQQGMQVYVFDEEGLKGQFQTKLPIQKARVATQGVVAVILADDDVTWVNFYDASGTLIAENRTTIDDFGTFSGRDQDGSVLYAGQWKQNQYTYCVL